MKFKTFNAYRRIISFLAFAFTIQGLFLSCITVTGPINPGQGNKIVYCTVKFDTGTENVILEDLKIQKGLCISNLEEYDIEDIDSTHLFKDWIYKNELFTNTTPVTKDIILTARWKNPNKVDGIHLINTEEKSILKWFKDDDYDEYQVSYKKTGDTTPTIETVSGSELILNDIKISETYTFEVSERKTSYEAFTNTGSYETKALINTDYLILFYMDGDNNLHSSLFTDLNEIENGLYYIRNEDGTPKADFASVSAIVLWDGYSGTDNKINTTYGTPGSYIYNLGADSSVNNSLSSKTINVSDSASFVSSHEVNMGSKDTLKAYYLWALNRYEADYIILQFSNHGGGARSVTYSQKDEFAFSDDLRRSMCWDDSSNKNFLKTKDVPVAMTEANMPKVDLIIEDVCLGASVEECYELKDSANYFLASANNIPGSGLNYVDLIKSFTADADIKSIGKEAVISYRNQYEYSQLAWEATVNSYKINEKTKALFENLSDEKINKYFSYLCYTLSLIDLSKIDEVKDAIDSLSDEIRFNGNNYTATINNTSCSGTDFIKYLSEYDIFAHIYQGTFMWLYDLSFLMTEYKTYAGTWEGLSSKSDAVISKLNDAIVYTWKDGYKKPTCDNVTQGASPYYSSKAGISIATGLVVINDNKICEPSYPSWYESDLQFGQNSSWSNLLSEWFETYNY